MSLAEFWFVLIGVLLILPVAGYALRRTGASPERR